MTDAARELRRFAWISIAAAAVTIGLKFAAWWVTDSVGLLSDALESVVNLVGAVATLIALWYAGREPDEEHVYGHAKAEYFSSGLEGALILLAAGVIALTAVPRLFDPEPVESIGVGTGVAIVAALINLLASGLIQRAADAHGSIALDADAHHLRTDFFTTAGVVAGVALISVTGWNVIDPIVALLVAANIIRVGFDLMRRSMLGLMDTALPQTELDLIQQVLGRYSATQGIQTHALRTRQAGLRRFGSVHILVPGSWTVDRGHRLVEQIEVDIREMIPGIMMVTHLESLDDPQSWDDAALPNTPAHDRAT
jgi:cation diffusion facilitator family transporter